MRDTADVGIILSTGKITTRKERPENTMSFLFLQIHNADPINRTDIIENNAYLSIYEVGYGTEKLCRLLGRKIS
jgi:hypothetical protein